MREQKQRSGVCVLEKRREERAEAEAGADWISVLGEEAEHLEAK